MVLRGAAWCCVVLRGTEVHLPISVEVCRHDYMLTCDLMVGANRQGEEERNVVPSSPRDAERQTQGGTQQQEE